MFIPDYKCLLGSTVIGRKTINEYVSKAGKYITEEITDFGNGNNGVREIYRNSNKDIEKVVDRFFGKLEVFYPAKVGIIHEVEGVKCSLPNYSMDKLLNRK